MNNKTKIDTVENFMRDYCREKEYDLYMQQPYHDTTKFIFVKNGATFAEVAFVWNEVTNVYTAIRSAIEHVNASRDNHFNTVTEYTYPSCHDYIWADIEMTKQMVNAVHGCLSLEIKNVIFNDPATIVFWADGTKTVVKAQENDWFDPEKGLAMAIAKKVYGNQGNYYNKLKKWLPEESDDLTINFEGDQYTSAIAKLAGDFAKALRGEKSE